jgi:integrase
VLVVRYGAKYYATTRLTLSAAQLRRLYRIRSQIEVLTLERRQLDLDAGTLRLEPGSTKNDDGRVVYLTAELKSLLGAQLERVRALE